MGEILSKFLLYLPVAEPENIFGEESQRVLFNRILNKYRLMPWGWAPLRQTSLEMGYFDNVVPSRVSLKKA